MKHFNRLMRSLIKAESNLIQKKWIGIDLKQSVSRSLFKKLTLPLNCWLMKRLCEIYEHSLFDCLIFYHINFIVKYLNIKL